MSVFGITNHNRTNSTKIDGSECGGKKQKSSIYDCTVEDAEYIYNTLSLLLLLKMCISELVIDVFYIFNSTVID